jgi:hypothetical protein
MVAQLLDNVGQIVMLPADQDISFPSIILDSFLDAFMVIPVAGCIHGKTQVFSEWKNSFIRTGTLAI